MKKKILLLSDDFRMSSGVSTMSKEIILGTVDKFDWVQIGAALNHPEYGKILDVSQDVRKLTGVEDSNVIVIPNNGYGDIFLLRDTIKRFKPDAILHFTDPHYWVWLYENEHEIRNNIPILYYHVWDNIPNPTYNKSYYQSCDWIGCISKLTYGVVHNVGKMNNGKTDAPLEDWQISYIPHGINENTFKPLKPKEKDDLFIKSIVGDKKYDFVLFYNNRNIRRKQPSDIIAAYGKFCDGLPKNKSSKCLLLMHTSSIDNNGTDLNKVKEHFCPEHNVIFTNSKYEQHQLNQLYNFVDCTINVANNEGFGLTTMESLMSGTPIIVNVTGGLQDQCGYEIDENQYIEMGTLKDKFTYPHGEWVIPIFPNSRNLNGSVTTPFLFEDRVDIFTITSSINRMYNKTKKERKEMGKLGREYALTKFKSSDMCDKISEGINNTLKNFKNKKKYELFKII